MPILTTKELQALSDQLDFEKVLHCKYLSAVQECQDDGLKGKLQSMADQHRQNYTTLLGYLKYGGEHYDRPGAHHRFSMQ